MKSGKGFFYVKSLNLHNRENRHFDVYYKVTGSGKGDKARSIAYIILAGPGENILLRDANAQNHSGKAAAASVGAVTFFETISSEVSEYELDQKIRQKESAVIMTEKKLNDLDKKRLSLEKELDELRKESQMQKGELEKKQNCFEPVQRRKSLKEKEEKLKLPGSIDKTKS